MIRHQRTHHGGRGSSRKRREGGATFAELMLATIVIGTTVVASTSSLRGSTEVYHYFAEGPHEALMLAQEVHEAAMQMPWEAELGAEGLFGDVNQDVWDLHEDSFSPPRSAEYEVVVSHLGWSQHVHVKMVDLNDPSVEVDPDTFEGDMLMELEVIVMRGGDVVGSHSWWLSNPDEEED